MALRRPTGVNIPFLVTAESMIPDQQPKGFFEAEIRTKGCRAAAWVVFKNRGGFVKNGQVEFTMPPDVETPAYFRVAMEYLKRRRGWSVVTMRVRPANDEGARKLPGRVYRVAWHAWTAAKQLRDAREAARCPN